MSSLHNRTLYYPLRLAGKRWLAFAHDLLWTPLALLLAYWFRFNLGHIPDAYWQGFLAMLTVALPVQAMACWLSGLYRGIWRFASMPDLIRILKAVSTGSLLTVLLVFIEDRLVGQPRSVLILYPLLLALGLGAPRMLYRWLKDHSLSLGTGKRALIIGAGRGGEMLVRDMFKNGGYLPVAFLDDSPDKQGMEIHGVRVFGQLDQLADLLLALEIDVVMVAIARLPSAKLNPLVAACNEAHIPCRLLPSLPDIAEGRVNASALREVRIEDLLGRDPVRLDLSGIHHLIGGKRVLVTGAGGSIGSELCRQIARFTPAKLILLDNGEYNLYMIDGEIGQRGVPYVAVLGDVRDASRMRWLFEQFQPELVFHAAAYKHVPIVEHNPAEGVATNIFGTRTVADLAVEFGVEKFVLVSTDKAVNPANIMGTTKRVAEIYCQNLFHQLQREQRSCTAFITTRFGNVLDSAGSVVPRFRQQIAQGGPVTVTHPQITRYFMTIPEAASLILQAGAMGSGGEIFVLDMGEPVRITDLAELMIRLSGLEPGAEIKIEYTGLRPGEKLYEELFHESEQLQGTSHAKILLSGSRCVSWEEMERGFAGLHRACASRDEPLLRTTLQTLVPEFVNEAAGG